MPAAMHSSARALPHAFEATGAQDLRTQGVLVPFWQPYRARVGLFAICAGALAACSGDHDFLAQRSVDAAPAMDASDVADVSADDRRVAPPRSDAPEASVDESVDVSEPPEPPGLWTFTWTNGIVDAASARFCFVPVVGGEEKNDGVMPEPPGGLAFGKSLVLGEVPGVDVSTMGLHPYAVVGEAATGDRSCAALLDAQDASISGDADAGGVYAVSLPLIPAGTLAEGRSYLGVVTGCAGRWPFPDVDASADAGDAGRDAEGGAERDGREDDGASRDASAEGDAAAGDADKADGTDANVADARSDVFRPPDRAAICGPSTGAPNAGLVLVRLSRRDVGTRFGLQAVHASAAAGGARIAVERPGGSAPIFSADLALSQIVPRDGLTAVTRDDFGPTLGAAAVRVASPVSAFPAVPFSLASALAASGIDESGLVEGDLLSLVLIGAQPGQDPGPPWNTARIAVVRNAPIAGGD